MPISRVAGGIMKSRNKKGLKRRETSQDLNITKERKGGRAIETFRRLNAGGMDLWQAGV